MALLQKKKPKTETLDRVGERELVNRIAVGRQAERELDEADGARLVRAGESDGFIRPRALAIKQAVGAAAELNRRRSARGDQGDHIRGLGPFEGLQTRHPELRGVTLNSALLTDADLKELRTLRRRWHDETGLQGGDLRRYERLLEQAAGDPGRFDRKRKETRVAADLAAATEKLHVSTLPKRAALAEPGSIALPSMLFQWLKNARPATPFSLVDIGVLATTLLSLENEDASLWSGARLEHDAGEPVIVMRADSRLGVASNLSNLVVDDALQVLHENDWITLERRGVEIRVGRGARAHALREGRV